MHYSCPLLIFCLTLVKMIIRNSFSHTLWLLNCDPRIYFKTLIFCVLFNNVSFLFFYDRRYSELKKHTEVCDKHNKKKYVLRCTRYYANQTKFLGCTYYKRNTSFDKKKKKSIILSFDLVCVAEKCLPVII